MPGTAPRFVCPRCRAAVVAADKAWHCPDCASVYPVLHGIADFRLQSDAYLGLDAERAKAARLADHARADDFEGLVRFYYAITGDVPPELAPRYSRYVVQATSRADDILDEAGDIAGETILDLGCGSGGLVAAAAARGAAVVGVDIALRWMVIAAKRLEQAGIKATLVCADAADLPFADGSFDRVFAVDLLENSAHPEAVVAEASRQLATGGQLWLSASNRLWLGPHPSVGVWAIGWLPRRAQAALLKQLRGVDSLRNVRLLSPLAAKRLCRAQGLTAVAAQLRRVGPRQVAARGRIFRAAAMIYGGIRSVRGLGDLTALAGPAFEVTARKKDVA